MKPYLSIILFAGLTFAFQKANGQIGYPISQPSIYNQVFFNTFSRTAHISLLHSTLEKTKKDKQKVLEAWTVTEQISNKIYKNLTNAENGLRNGKMMVTITKRVPNIIKNVAEAGKIAVGKPYLITIWKTTGRSLVDRSLRLYDDINNTVLSANKEMLINQAKRDALLWEIYQQIQIIYNISQNMIYEFKWYTLQQAINRVYPYKFYINLDKSIVNQTINKFKF